MKILSACWNMFSSLEMIFVVMIFSSALYMLILISKKNLTIQGNIYYMSRTGERNFFLVWGW